MRKRQNTWKVQSDLKLLQKKKRANFFLIYLVMWTFEIIYNEVDLLRYILHRIQMENENKKKKTYFLSMNFWPEVISINSINLVTMSSNAWCLFFATDLRA